MRAKARSRSRSKGAATAAIMGGVGSTSALSNTTRGNAMGPMSKSARARLSLRAPVRWDDVGTLESVNVAQPRQLSVRRGRPLMSAIAKARVEGRVRVAGINVEGDRQADLRVHGGPDKAVYAYAAEDIAWWSRALDRPLPPGMFGENLTVSGIDVSGAVVGERWVIADVELEVCQPRLPCAKLGLRFGDPGMVKRFGEARRPGAYLRIVREGTVGAGDAIEVRDRPEHGVTVALVSAAILLDERLLARAAAAPELPAALAGWMRERAA